MGKFDGYLICSDVDGTFHMGDTIAVNSEAVRYFTENGGRFTFVTGRTVDYLRRPDLFGVINAPACLFNGSVVYDYSREQVLAQRYLSISLGEFLEQIQGFQDSITNLYAYEGFTGDGLIFQDLASIPEAAKNLRPLKLICTFRNAEDADCFQRSAENTRLPEVSYISKSWSVGVEFNPLDGTKGHGLDFIKAYLGDIHTAIGIGDYDNDVTLLTHADLAVAVENAVPAVKAAAQLTVCHASQFALRALIEHLDQKI